MSAAVATVATVATEARRFTTHQLDADWSAGGTSLFMMSPAESESQ